MSPTSFLFFRVSVTFQHLSQKPTNSRRLFPLSSSGAFVKIRGFFPSHSQCWHFAHVDKPSVWKYCSSAMSLSSPVHGPSSTITFLSIPAPPSSFPLSSTISLTLFRDFIVTVTIVTGCPSSFGPEMMRASLRFLFSSVLLLSFFALLLSALSRSCSRLSTVPLPLADTFHACSHPPYSTLTVLSSSPSSHSSSSVWS